MKVRITSAAWRDLHAIGDWLALADPDTAVTITDELLDRAEQLGTVALHYPVVAKRDDAELRKRSHRGYVILYRTAAEVEVLRIVRERRDYLSLL